MTIIKTKLGYTAAGALLTVFALYPNNAAERALRAVALGRKNYLFAGSDRGASYCPSDYLLIN